MCKWRNWCNRRISINNYGKKSKIEQSEDIEILRFFELNKTIRLVQTSAGSLAVDKPEDVEKVEKVLKEYNTSKVK